MVGYILTRVFLYILLLANIASIVVNAITGEVWVIPINALATIVLTMYLHLHYEQNRHLDEIEKDKHPKVRKSAGDVRLLQKWDTVLQDDRWRHLSCADLGLGDRNRLLERERTIPDALHAEVQRRDRIHSFEATGRY